MNKEPEFQFGLEQKKNQAKQKTSKDIQKKINAIKDIKQEHKCLYLLLEIEQFEKFEHWILMGLIFLDFQNSGSKLEGAAEKLGAIPICTQPVNFDVLIQVKLFPNEYSNIEWCTNNKNLGWLKPGILPINRIQSVVFESSTMLDSTSKLLNDGAVLPEVLKAYMTQTEWSIINDDNGKMSQEQVISTLREEKCLSQIENTRKLIFEWDKKYGQLSFLKSLSVSFPNYKLTTHILTHIKSILGEYWLEMTKLISEIQEEDCWDTTEFYDGMDIRDAMKEHYRNENGPEVISRMKGHEESFARKLAEFIEDADFRWGKVLSENQPLTANFKVIQSLNSDPDVDDYLFTQAIIAISASANRMNLNSYGESQSIARSRNFKIDDRPVYMTFLPSDSINNFLCEFCFSAIKKEPFDQKLWLKLLNLSEDLVIDLKHSHVSLLGMNFMRNLNSNKSTKLFVKLNNNLRNKIESTLRTIDDLKEEKESISRKNKMLEEQLNDKDKELNQAKRKLHEIQNILKK